MIVKITLIIALTVTGVIGVISLLSEPQADITLTVTATSRQIVIRYTAPDTNTCTVEGSESNTYSPLVNDVNTSLFSGANLDSRAGSLGAGTVNRVFVLGTIPDMKGLISNLASDGKRYGLALQPATTHYIRVTCGSHTGVTSITTRNRPLGMTRSWERPMASAGVYAYPTLDESDRNQVLSDPVTGIRIRKLSNPNEDTTGGPISTPASGAPWTFAQSTINDGNGVSGYISAWPTDGGSSRLYFVTDSESRFLGSPHLYGGQLVGFNTGMFFPASNPQYGTNPTQLFYLVRDGTDGNGNAQVVRCQLPASGSSAYNASAASGADAPCTFANLTSSNSITSQLQAFDPMWDGVKFGNFANQVVQGNYLLFNALRGGQDSYGWVGAIDLSTTVPSVVGFAPLWLRGGSGALSFRWCAIHTAHPALGSNRMSFTAKAMYQSGLGAGPYITTVASAMNNSQMTITLASNTPTSPNPDTTLYSIAPGDEIKVNNEVMYVGSFISGTTWNLSGRGQAGSGAPVSHNIGETVLMQCRCHNPSDYSQVGPSWWDFLADPHGTNTTGTNLITQLANASTYSGHEGFANGRGIAETGYAAFIGPSMANNSVFTILDSPQFAGASKSASGNAWNKHSAASQQSNADQSQSPVWGLDSVAADTDPEISPTSMINVTGSLWKFANTNYTLKRKQLAMLAVVGAKPLLDISSPTTGDVISGLAGDNYKYCVANTTGECRASANAGDIYVNAPSLTSASNCFGFFNYSTTDKICIGHFPTIGASIVQIGIVEGDSNGKWFRALTDGLMPVKIMSIGSDSHQTPDGKWATIYNIAPSGKTSILLAKVPAWPGFDGISRNTFQQKTLSLPAMAGADNVIVEFGYDTNLYPTSRSEVGVAAANSNPYFFASETYNGVPCTNGCSISIPIIPDRIAYYRVRWRNGSTVISTSSIDVVSDTSAPIPPSPTPTPTVTPTPTPSPTVTPTPIPTPVPTPTPTPVPTPTPGLLCKPNQPLSSGCVCMTKVIGPPSKRRCK